MNDTEEQGMIRDILNRQVEVIGTLSRMETKLNIACAVQKKNCEDIEELQKSKIEADVERRTTKFIVAGVSGVVGFIGILIPVLAYFKVLV